jgi:hypothetical protein
MYRKGTGVEKDETAELHHLEAAAIGFACRFSRQSSEKPDDRRQP